MPKKLPTQTREAVAPLLLLALKSAGVGVVVKSTDDQYLYASMLPDYFPQLEVSKMSDQELFSGDWFEQMQEAQRKVLTTGEEGVVELSRANANQYQVCHCTVQAYEAVPGSPAILMTFVDLTMERKREETLKALLRELSHRSKNLLAIVQSIANQTARTSTDLEEFVGSFRGRIAALSSAQDLVTDSNWRGAMLKELAARQLARYVEDSDPRVLVTGDDMLLEPNAATHIGLALHELIANALAHGALSKPGGRISLFFHRPDDNGKFEILWDEETGRNPEVQSDPSGKTVPSFGSAVLMRVVPAALDGEAEYQIGPGRVQYRLVFGV